MAGDAGHLRLAMPRMAEDHHGGQAIDSLRGKAGELALQMTGGASGRRWKASSVGGGGAGMTPDAGILERRVLLVAERWLGRGPAAAGGGQQ